MCAMSPRLLRPRQAGFDPRTISGLALWLDASASTTLYQSSNGTTAATASSDPVGYWGDRSGNGKNATQSTANSRPIISPNQQNGKTVLRWDGLDDFYSFTSTALQSVFVVLWVKTESTRVLPSVIGNSTGSPDLRRDYDANAPIPTVRYRGKSGDGSGSDGNDFANPAGSQFRISGVSTPNVAEQVWHVLTAIRGTGTANLDRIGRVFPTRDYGGDMAEIIAYNRAVTDSERDTIEKALGKKWGITIG